MDVRMFTVGLVQENCFVVRRDGAQNALIVDPATRRRASSARSRSSA